MDKEDILELLDYVEQSVILIANRFKPIGKPDDFLKDDVGLEKLDAISMRLNGTRR